jgi:hypothetical protein
MNGQFSKMSTLRSWTKHRGDFGDDVEQEVASKMVETAGEKQGTILNADGEAAADDILLDGIVSQCVLPRAR